VPGARQVAAAALQLRAEQINYAPAYLADLKVPERL
jgi:hypothetical protein